MIDVEFRRVAKKFRCASCGNDIEQFAPAYFIEIYEPVTFILCEDCGNYLQNDINDRHSEFVDMGE